MSLLPQPLDSAHYWSTVYKQELPVWQPAISEVTKIHHLSNEIWTRVALGRNIVFCSPTSIIKLGPPRWSGEMAREVAALRLVAENLSVATPTVLASGTIDGWDYIVQERLPGTPLWELWNDLSPEAQIDLAYQHGQLMKTIHTLRFESVPSELQIDWDEMLAEQSQECVAEMLDAGVDAKLVAQVDSYLAATEWSIDAAPDVLLHGDLNHLNFLVSRENDHWRLTGLVDWGDAKVGAPSHEFISPGVNMYSGNRAMLTQLYRGYQLDAAKYSEAYEHVVMARAMLYYADSFLRLLQDVEGAAMCNNWRSIARCFWHLT
ncbi:MAG: aminoglycoside 3'-phosphotransferase/choline kinase family protein [Chloroflexota bacterium]